MRAILIDKYGFKKLTDVPDDRRVIAIARHGRVVSYSQIPVDPSDEIDKNYAEFYFERSFENEDDQRVAIYRER